MDGYTPEQIQELAKAQNLLNSLLDDPKHGMTVKKAIKDKYPEARIRELDIIEQVTKPYDEKLSAIEAQNKALQDAFDEYRTKNETKEAEVSLKSNLDRVKSQYSLTDEGMQKVIENMRERNLAHDPDAAAALYVQSLPKAKPQSIRDSLITPPIDLYGMADGDPDAKWKLLHSNPDRFLQEEVVACLEEFATSGV